MSAYKPEVAAKPRAGLSLFLAVPIVGRKGVADSEAVRLMLARRGARGLVPGFT
jgi:hypothetical protein